RTYDTADTLFPAPPGKDPSWVLISEEEAWDIRHRSVALAGRFQDDRSAAADLAKRHGTPALWLFGPRRGLLDAHNRTEDVREAAEWLASLAQGQADRFDEQSEYGRVRELIGILRHLPTNPNL